jgi:hypothetical protein
MKKKLKKEIEYFFQTESEYTKNHKLFMTNEILRILDKYVYIINETE